jgi:hypothetical protein
MRKLLLIALCSSCLMAPQAWAADLDWMSGNSLFKECQQDDEDFCLGYIMGAVAGLSVSGTDYCLPDDATGSQLADTVKSWLRANPNKRKLASTVLITQGLRETFPCE